VVSTPRLMIATCSGGCPSRMCARFTAIRRYRRSSEMTPAVRMAINRRANVSVVAGRMPST
jgi:hypothetical protein